MRESGLCVGIDTSTRTFGVCIKDSLGNIVAEAKTEASFAALADFFCNFNGDIRKICLESCSTSLAVTRELRQHGFVVAMYNPRHVHNFLRLRQNKTDRNDARGLADIARLAEGALREVHLKSPTSQMVRTQLVVREVLIKQRKASEALLMSIFHLYGVRAANRVHSSISLVGEINAMLEAVPPSSRDEVERQISPLLRVSLSQREETKKIDAALRAFASSCSVWKRLSTIPGIGVVTGLSFITAIDDPWRFKRNCDVGPYLGLTPRAWETGKYSQRRGISKAGSKMTRKHLNIAAQATLRVKAPNELQAWAHELTKRAGRKKAVVALSRKLAVVMLAMWKSGQSYSQQKRLDVKL